MVGTRINTGLLTLVLAGCGTLEQDIAAGVGATGLAAASVPAQALEQIYYIGIYDQREQLPPEFYRIRVRGQGSFLSDMRFGSGWVPAQVVDSLNTTIAFSDSGEFGQSSGDPSSALHGRKLVLYGPEGFREIPEAHRLVVVMGQSPESFFNAVDESLGAIADADVEAARDALLLELVRDQRDVAVQRQRLLDLDSELEEDGP